MHFRRLFPVFFCLVFCAVTQLSAQCYTTFRQDGIDFYNKGKWADAKAQFQEAADCKSDKPANNDLSVWIGKCDKKIAEAAERVRQRREQEEAERLAQQQAAATRAADDSFWEALKDGDAADCDKYLRRYPSGRHATEARRRKEALGPTPLKPNPPLTTPSASNVAYRDCSECPLMMPVKGGIYMMGIPSDERDSIFDECQHPVTVESFSIGVYEVTVEEYLRFADATNSHYPVWLEEGDKDHIDSSATYKWYSRSAKALPICGVSWGDASAYCNWLSRKTGKKYRLLLEKEWEYAAKGGKKTRNYIYAGSNDIKAVAWNKTKAERKPNETPFEILKRVNQGIFERGEPHTIGGKAANELGLYDMSGNLWEWCQDTWGPYFGCTANECVGCAVLRGGSWGTKDNGCRSANRSGNASSSRSNRIGFRCARDGQ